jgi:hypothetical protein
VSAFCCPQQINYHATNEYDALVNYKVLQQGFTAINLTRVRANWCWPKLQTMHRPVHVWPGSAKYRAATTASTDVMRCPVWHPIAGHTHWQVVKGVQGGAAGIAAVPLQVLAE